MELTDRIDRLNQLFAGVVTTRDFPLLKEVPVSEQSFRRIAYATSAYILDAIINWYEEFEDTNLDEGFLERNLERILGLPNITPNGLILPKRQTALSYNSLHKAVTQWFKALGISHHISRAQSLNVRLVSGTSDSWRDEREYSARKVHSDVWGDQPANMLNIFLPISGDFERSGVIFYETQDFPENLIGPIEDYSEGAALAESAQIYDARFGDRKCLVADALCLHRTMPSGGGPRLSLEFRVLLKNLVDSDLYTQSGRLPDYLDYPDWLSLGTSRVLIQNEPLAEFNEKILKSTTISAVERVRSI